MRIAFLFLVSLVIVPIDTRADLAEEFGLGEVYEDCKQYAPVPGSSDYTEMVACAYRVKAAKEANRLKRQSAAASAQKQREAKNSPSHGSMSYQRCILDKAPQVQNDLAAGTVVADCRQHKRYAREPMADRFFGLDTAKECFAEHGGQTQSTMSSKMIAMACLDLYPGRIY